MYLGLIIDPKLNFERNSSHAVTKARRLTMALRKKASKHWGQNTENSLRTIYKGAVLPILGYGSRVWINRLPYSKINRKYLSAYGMAARVITQSYISVSTDAAGVLAGLLPADLELEKSLCISELKRGRSAAFQNELVLPGQFDTIMHAAQYLQLKAEDIWQERWDNSLKGRITHDFLPEVSTNLSLLPVTNFTRTQVLTGHGSFGCHLYRIGKTETDECDACPNLRDDPKHRILNCPKYLCAQEAIHEEMIAWPPEMVKIPFLKDGSVFSLLIDPNPPPFNEERSSSDEEPTSLTRRQ